MDLKEKFQEWHDAPTNKTVAENIIDLEKIARDYALGFGLFISHNQIKCDSDGWWEWDGLKTTDELILCYEKGSSYFL